MTYEEKMKKIIKGLECCSDSCKYGCPYALDDVDHCEWNLMRDAAELIKEQAEYIEELDREHEETANGLARILENTNNAIKKVDNLTDMVNERLRFCGN